MIDMFLQIFIFIEMVFWQLFYLLLAMPFTLILICLFADVGCIYEYHKNR